MKNALVIMGNEATMTSVEIAKLTGKEHSNVLRDIRTLLDGLGDSNLNPKQYQLLTLPNGMTKQIDLDKELTMTLVSGYSAVMRHAIIKRWQELETKQSKPSLPPEKQLLIDAIYDIEAIKTRMDVIEAKQAALGDDYGFYSILAYSKIKGLKFTSAESAKLGKLAAKASQVAGYQMGQVPDARWGTVNTYHTDILSEIF